MNKGVVAYPDFDFIIEECKKKIQKNFSKYGNSWQDDGITLQWWKKRLKREINEVFEARSVKQFVDEIPDAINILAFMFSRAKILCSKCGKGVISFHVINGKKVCQKCYIG